MNIEYRVEQIEKCNAEMSADIKLIMRNHLPHIQTEIVKVKTELRIFGAVIMLILGAIIRLVTL